jgi:hypothetical protein
MLNENENSLSIIICVPDVDVGNSQVSQVASVVMLGKLLLVGPEAYCSVAPELRAIELSIVEVEPSTVAAANKLPETRDPTKAKEATPPKTTAFLRLLILNESALGCLGKNPLGLKEPPGSTNP